MTLKFSRNAKVTRALTNRHPVRLQLLMTLKFSRNSKVTRALTGQRSVRPTADDDFEIYSFS